MARRKKKAEHPEREAVLVIRDKPVTVPNTHMHAFKDWFAQALIRGLRKYNLGGNEAPVSVKTERQDEHGGGRKGSSVCASERRT